MANLAYMKMDPNRQLTETEIQGYIDAVNTMDHETMARLWRFSPAENPIFSKAYPIYDHFIKRFNEFGGWTPELSKRIGW